MFKTIQKNSHPNHHRQKFSANVKSFGKLVLLTATSVCGLGYVGKYLTNQLNALKSSNNDGEGMLGQKDHYKTRYAPIRSVSFNTGRKLLSSNNFRISKLYDAFQLNTQSIGAQNSPSVVGLLNGNLVAVWTSVGQDGSYDGIYGQIYNNIGVTIGSEFRVNNYTDNSQYQPSISSLSDGKFVVVWTSVGQDSSSSGVYAQIYSNTGVAIGSEFRVNTYTYDSQGDPRIVGLSNGNFVVVWYSYGQDGSGGGIYAQIYTNTGAAVGSEFRVNTYTTNSQYSPRIVGLSNGNFVIAWNSDYQDGSGSGIYCQMYNPSGDKIGREFKVNDSVTYDQTLSAIAVLNNDNFIIGWTSSKSVYVDGASYINYGIYGKIYTKEGLTVGTEFLMSDNNIYNYHISPTILSLSDSTFVVAHTVGSYDTGGGYHVYPSAIQGQLFDFSGNKVNSPFTVAYTASESNSITNLTNNNFVISWTNNNEVFAQLFNIITYTPTLTNTATSSQSKTNSFSHTQTNTPTVTFSSLSRLSSVSPRSSASPQSSFSPKSSLSPSISLSSIVSNDLFINIKTISYSNPAVATLLNENIVVAWSDNYSGQIYCQIYTKNGIKVGSELQVSSDNSLYARCNPVIKVLSNGNFVIGWESSIKLRSGVVSTRLFTTTGEAISGENQIKTYSYIYDPLSQSGISSITDLSNGNFIVVWQDAYADLHAQIYTNTGAVANTFNIESFSGASDEGEANVVKLNNGNLVITCNVYTTSSKGSIREVYGVFYSIYTDTGGKVNSYLSYLNAGSYYGRPEVAALSNSNFVIVSTIYDANGYKVLTQIYTQTGVKIATIKSNTYTSEWTPIAVSSLNNDNFVVMWYNNSKPCARIYAQIYTNVGIAVNSEFLVSMYYDTFKGFYTTGTATGYSATFNFKPSISAYYANNFIVAWSTIDGIYAQMFSSVNYAMNYSASINLTCSPMVSSMTSPSTRVLAPSFSPYMPYSSPTREYSSTSPSSSPLAPSDKDYKSSACMNKPLLISFIQSTKTNTKRLLNYAAKRIVNVWLDDEEKDNDKIIINNFSKLKI